MLPRDLELKIIKHFDIDTRLKLGLPPCKLKVPENLTKLIEGITRPSCGSVCLSKCIITWYSSFGLKRIIWMNFEREVTYSVQSKDLENYDWYIF